ncbi:hypothetical protein [Marinicellulosiphila megalodicopiae]|uniref:hypothetical protein n=1 Tax=Marinicellulosiphila megalodicopiae TaxID=2724896 RepID=UPI003BB215C6
MKILTSLILLLISSNFAQANDPSNIIFNVGAGASLLDKGHANENEYTSTAFALDLKAFLKINYFRVGLNILAGGMASENIEQTPTPTHSYSHTLLGLSLGGTYSINQKITFNLDLIKSTTSLSKSATNCVDCEPEYYEQDKLGLTLSPSVVYLTPKIAGPDAQWGIYLQQYINLDTDSIFDMATTVGFVFIL